MVLEKIKAILSGQFDVEEDSITPETNLADDLGADSLDVVDLLMSIEDEFEVEIPRQRSGEHQDRGRAGGIHREPLLGAWSLLEERNAWTLCPGVFACPKGGGAPAPPQVLREKG